MDDDAELQQLRERAQGEAERASEYYCADNHIHPAHADHLHHHHQPADAVAAARRLGDIAIVILCAVT
ncbi:hypothetical protein Q1695_000588 [Nippostrongylus brasiliensis]|nr:hypothetical protein Q1695_000588 [Nippostrongylus brasiliensis]